MNAIALDRTALPAVTRPGRLPYDAELVIYRLEEAGRTLLALPGKDCFPAGYRSNWPTVVHAAVEAYGWTAEYPRLPVPDARTISRMDEALRWIGLVPLLESQRGSGQRWSPHGPAVLRRLVLMRALVSPRTERHLWSFNRLSNTFGTSKTTVQRWHAAGVSQLVAALNMRAH